MPARLLTFVYQFCLLIRLRRHRIVIIIDRNTIVHGQIIVGTGVQRSRLDHITVVLLLWVCASKVLVSRLLLGLLRWMYVLNGAGHGARELVLL